MCPSTSLPAPHASTKCFLRSLAGAAAATLLLCGTAHAAGSGMPWEQPLEQVLLSVQGPVARIVAVIIIINTGLTPAFVETRGAFRRLPQPVFALTIAFAARPVFTTPL